MLSTFKKFFGRRSEEKVAEAPLPLQPPPVAPAQPTARARVDFGPGPVAKPMPGNGAPINPSSTLALPLRTIIGRLPSEVMDRVLNTEVGEAEVFIPMQKVLSQLAQGAVRISFGELRQASPSGTFSSANDRDRILVELPLQEILMRVGSGGLSRRPMQKRVEVPPEVVGPFGGQNRVTFSDTTLKPAAPVRQAPAPEEPIFKRTSAPTAPTPPTPVYSPIAPTSLPPARSVPLPNAPAFNRASPPAAPVKPAFVPEEPIFKRTTPSAPVNPVQPAAVPEAPIFRRSPAPTPAPLPAAQPAADEIVFKRATPASPAQPVSPIVPEPPQAIPFGEPAVIPAPSLRTLTPPQLSTPAPVALPTPDAGPEPIRFNPSFAPPPAQAPKPPTPAAPRETIFLPVPLAGLAEAWPEPIKQELVALGLLSATVALPQGMIEAAIKQGRVVFPWKLIRSWTKPPVSPLHASPHDAVTLELPLKIVTPAFMASMRTVRPQRKISIDANIPNLFSGTAGAEALAVPQTAAPPPAAPVHARVPVPAPVPAPLPISIPAPAPAAPQSTDTNYYVWKENGAATEEPAPVVKKGPSPGTSFLQRYATPNEIVSKAAALNGVGGALIALPDGLLVASKIPSEMNADTLAAFLPQIFGRVSQSTRELRMGDLNNLNFTVGLIPWKIFRVGAIYFAAFGVAGQALPTAQLAAIAAELDRKAK